MIKKNNLMKLDWIALEDYDDVISVISFVERNDKKIKDYYLKKIKSTKEIEVLGQNFFEIFNWNHHFNFLKMSNLFEMSFYKNPEINESLKLIGLKFIIKKYNPKSVSISNSPNSVNSALNSLSINEKIHFEFKDELNISFSKGIKKIIPNYFTSVVWLLMYFFKNKAKGKNDWKKFENSIFLMGYFTHVNRNQLLKNQFKSGMWGSFFEYFSRDSYFNFLHHYIPNRTTENIEVGQRQLNLINTEKSTHNFIDNFMSFNSIIKVLLIYTKTYLKTFLLLDSYSKRINQIFGFKIMSFYQNDVKSSLDGINLIQNIFWCIHFDKIFSVIPFQKKGFYLMENQGWEFAFIDAWKKHNHGKLYAIQHSTLAFWDLRYSYPFLNEKYSPDLYLVNSKNNLRTFLEYGYPKSKVFMIETLRYYYLNEIIINRNLNSVLIFGDIIYDLTTEMINTVNEILDDFKHLSFSFKAHPALNLNFKDISPDIKIVKKDVRLLFPYYDTIICPSSSGVAAEAYALGLKVIVFIKPGEINTSPLKKYEHVHFASNSSDISNALSIKDEINKHSSFLEFKTDKSKFLELIS